MLKQRIIRVIVGLALLAAVVGSSGIVDSMLGITSVQPAYACGGGGTGGEC